MSSSFRIIHTPFVSVTDAQGRSQSKRQPYRPMLDPCRLCPARCCHTEVKVSLPDVIRLCGTLKLPFFAAFVFEPSTNHRRGIRLAQDDRLSALDEEWTGLAEIRMRRRDNGGCFGLNDIGGYLRCGVYDARPMNCRLYPLSWEDDAGRFGPTSVLCPAPFAVTPEVARQAESDAATAHGYWSIHETAVARWNASTTEATVEAALPFLLTEVAAALDVQLDPVILIDGTPEQRLGRELLDRGILSGPVPHDRDRTFAGLPARGRPR